MNKHNKQIYNQYKRFVWARHHKRNTRLTYTDHIRNLLTYLQKPYTEINQNDLDRYIQEKLETRSTNGNSIRFWSIQKFIDWTQRHDLTMPKITPVDPGKNALQETEIQKIFQTLPTLSHLHQLIFYLEYDTIRRPREITQLKINNRYQNKLTLDTKTGKKTVMMTNRLIESWNNYIEHERPHPINKQEAQYLILSAYSRTRGQHYKWQNAINRHIKEILMYSNVELPPDTNPSSYLIKRSSITTQLKYCVDPKIIQLQAGHTKLSQTMKYNRISEKHIKAYLDKFEHKSTNINEKEDTIPHKSFLPRHQDSPASLHKSNLWMMNPDNDDDEKSDNSSITVSFSFDKQKTPFDMDERQHCFVAPDISDTYASLMYPSSYCSSISPFSPVLGSPGFSFCIHHCGNGLARGFHPNFTCIMPFPQPSLSVCYGNPETSFFLDMDVAMWDNMFQVTQYIGQNQNSILYNDCSTLPLHHPIGSVFFISGLPNTSSLTFHDQTPNIIKLDLFNYKNPCYKVCNMEQMKRDFTVLQNFAHTI